MSQVRDVEITDADISNAMIETEKEIAGAAWGDEETEALDATGDKSLESLGDGLEGQHEEDEPEEEAEGEESEGEEGEESEEQPPLAAEKAAGEEKPEGKEEQPQGRIPPGRLREANERARQAEAERDQLRQQLEARSNQKDPELETLKTQVATLTQLLQGKTTPQQETKQQPQTVEPDIFEDPTGFKKSITDTVQSEVGKVLKTVRDNAVSMSFELAHVRHGEAFPKAMEAINRLDVNNPDDRTTVQRIYNSPNPGEALVAWHKRSEALTRVGNDPDAYEQRIREETRQSLMNDPEFKKQLIASLRADAQQGDDGRPRTTTRLPTSVARASGSNVGAGRESFTALDGSDQSVADAAWR